MPPSGDSLYEILEWDSAFFGFRIARARVPSLTAGDAGRLLRECDAEGVRCLYFLAAASDAETVRVLEDSGFGLKDIRLTLIHKAPASSAAAGIRPVEAADVPALRHIARESHHDTRFYCDTNFPRGRCDDLYDAWITKSCLSAYADAVLVAEAGHRPAGYVTCSMRDPARGQIGLFAVAAEARGTGLGRCLIRAALAWFDEHGAHEVITVTQGKNIAAVRAYERCGFVAENVRLWYHRWFNVP
jgi:GNAT superfamily N-acetyltransferase